MQDDSHYSYVYLIFLNTNWDEISDAYFSLLTFLHLTSGLYCVLRFIHASCAVVNITQVLSQNYEYNYNISQKSEEKYETVRCLHMIQNDKRLAYANISCYT